MANYYATTRSNYFRVKDTNAFEEWCSDRSLEHWNKEIDGETYHAVSANTGDCAGWPSSAIEEIEEGVEDAVEIDFAAELADHLDPRDVAIIMEVGNEKLRYLCGYATAIRSDGQTRHVSLQQIYDQARAAFKDPDLQITDAHY